MNFILDPYHSKSNLAFRRTLWPGLVPSVCCLVLLPLSLTLSTLFGASISVLLSPHGAAPGSMQGSIPPVFRDGARYDPTTDTWTPIPPTSAPEPVGGGSLEERRGVCSSAAGWTQLTAPEGLYSTPSGDWLGMAAIG